MPSGLPDPLVVVGLTGVGKSTLVARLVSAAGYRRLPDRRVLADRVAIPAAQRALGEPLEPVADRLERFRLTRRYREDHPGGMAEALAELLASEPAPPPRLFDNLRGPNEVRWALEHLPAARFVALDAPPATRAERLLGRASAFDRAEANDDPARAVATAAGALELTTEELERLRRSAAPHGGERALAAALVIVAEERRSYGDGGAETLRGAPERALVVDTAGRAADEVAAAVLDWVSAADGRAER